MALYLSPLFSPSSCVRSIRNLSLASNQPPASTPGFLCLRHPASAKLGGRVGHKTLWGIVVAHLDNAPLLNFGGVLRSMLPSDVLSVSILS